jgi:hypothetical protein
MHLTVCIGIELLICLQEKNLTFKMVPRLSTLRPHDGLQFDIPFYLKFDVSFYMKFDIPLFFKSDSPFDGAYNPQ